MSNPARFTGCLLAILLAGCARPPRANLSHVPDWESPSQAAATRPNPSHQIESGPRLTNSSAAVSPSGKAAPGTAPPGSGAGVWLPLSEWSGRGEAGLVSRLATPAPSYSLHSNLGNLVLRSGSRIARWEGIEVRLGFAPWELEHELLVHQLDLKKTIEPLVAPPPHRANRTVVLDPGHGGSDCGARSVLGKSCEKDYTLDWALRLREVLAEQGWQVSLTRSADTDLPLTNRVGFAVAQQAALFVSLHFNSAAPNHTEAGLETYCLTPAGMPSTLTRGYADEVSDAYPNNEFDAENLDLAVRVHRALLQANGNADRGVRRVRFPAVLRGQQCPAVLIEGGYLSNPQEAQRIANPAYRQKLAEAVARGLNAFPSQ